MMEIRRLEKTEFESWDRLVYSSPIGMIFHTSDWLNIHEKTLGMQITRLGVFRGGNLVGVFPVWFGRSFFIKGAHSPAIQKENPYGGPVMLPDERGVISEIIKYTMRTCAFTNIYFPPTLAKDFPCYSDLEFFNNSLEKEHTYVVDLREPENILWRNLEKRCKGAVRQAIAKGVQVKDAEDTSCVNIYYEILTETYNRSGFSPLPMSFYVELFRTLKRKNEVKLLFAQYDGAPIAAACFLIYRGRVNYWTGGSLSKFWKLRPNNLIQWELIKWAKREGLETYDLQGANIPNIAKFKASFGGKFTEYLRLLLTAFWAKPLMRIYRTYSKIAQGS